MARSWKHQLIGSRRRAYRHADRRGKGAILDEICARTGYHRKYAIQLLNRFDTHRAPRTRGRPRRTSPLTDKVLGAMWYALGRPGARQLRDRMPEGLDWARQQFQLAGWIERQLLSMSARTIDRRLEAFRKQIGTQGPIVGTNHASEAKPNQSKRNIGAPWPRRRALLRSSPLEARRARPRLAAPTAGERDISPGAQGEGRMSAEFSTRKQKNVMIVSAEGKMVAGDQAFRLMKLAIRTMNETDIRKFVVDLGKVTLIDSAGVGELVAVNSAVKEKGGQLRLANLEDSVGKVLQMAMIHKIIPSFDTQKEAIASLANGDSDE